jgi:prefoldin subunit 5
MAGKSTISITFKLDGDGKGFKDLANDAEGLKKIVSSTISEAQQLNTEAINFASVASGINQMQESLTTLRDALADLTAGYNYAVEAETKLTTVMAQRMNATQQEIESIKALALAEREKGVVDDDVQLMGAQQIATFLTQADSIETLLPAMNNLIAQQKGYSATGQDAVNVGNLMGKVMQGQTSALTRVGITFSEAEEQVLKYGTESERAAMLAQVITNNVGEMNAALGATDVGKQVQLEAKLGDIQDKLGEMLGGAQPFVNMATGAAQALASVVILAAGIKKGTAAIVAFNIKGKASAAVTLLMGVNAKKSAAVMHVFSSAMKTGAYSATAFKLALRGLLIATGIGAAITVLTVAIEKLSAASDKAAEKEREAAEEMANFKKEARDLGKATGENAQKEITHLEKLIGIAKDETKSKKDRAAAITELQNKYPSYFSDISAEKIEVKKLTTVYQNLRTAILEAARARAAQDKLEANTGTLIDVEMQLKQKQAEAEALQEQINDAERRLSQARQDDRDTRDSWGWFANAMMAGEKVQPLTQGNLDFNAASKDLRNYRAQLNSVNSDIAKLTAQQTELNAANTELTTIIENMPDLGGTGGGDGGGGGSGFQLPNWKKDAANLQDIGNNIQILNAKLQTATVEEAALINQQIAAWNAKADAIRNAGKAVEETTPTWKAQASTLQDIGDNIQILNNRLQTATIEEAALINQQIDAWNAKADAIRNAGKAAEETAKSTSEGLLESWGAIKGIGNSVESITNALEGNGTAWQQVVAIVDGFIGLYEGVKTIIGIIELLTAASAAHATTKGVEAAAEGTEAATRATAAATNATAAATTIVANKLETASWKELAAAEYMAAHAYIPFAGYGIAAGFTAAMIATVTAAGIPALAEGGVATGPTLALVGEYAGASGNPEVIAPLDKLRALLPEPEGGPMDLQFKIKGDDLVAVYNRRINKVKRT